MGSPVNSQYATGPSSPYLHKRLIGELLRSLGSTLVVGLKWLWFRLLPPAASERRMPGAGRISALSDALRRQDLSYSKRFMTDAHMQ